MDSDLVQVNWETRQKILFSNLSALRCNEVHTDITLSCDGEDYAAHRLILSMGSGYFAKYLERYKNASPSLVLICGVRPCILKALLNFIYDGSTTIERKDIGELSQAGAILEVPGLKNLGNEYSPANKSTSSDRSNKSEMSTTQSYESSHTKKTRRSNSSESTRSASSESTCSASSESTISASSGSINIEDESNLGKMKSIKKEIKEFPSGEEQSCKVVTSTTLSFEDLFVEDSNMSFSFEGWRNDGTEVFGTESVRGKRNFKCHLCRRSFFKPESLNKHIDSHSAQMESEKSSPEYSKCHNGREIFYNCSICKRGFKSEKNCKAHVGTHIYEKENVDKNVLKKEEVAVEVCPADPETLDKKTEGNSKPPINGIKNGESLRTTAKKRLNLKKDPIQKRRKKDEESCKEFTMDDVLKTVSQSFEIITNDSGYLVHDDKIYDLGLTEDQPGSKSPPNSPSNNSEKVEPLSKGAETSNLGQADSPVETTRTCNFCNTEFLNTRSFRKHRLTDCSVLICPFCSARFESRKEYGEHITVHNSTDKK